MGKVEMTSLPFTQAANPSGRGPTWAIVCGECGTMRTIPGSNELGHATARDLLPQKATRLGWAVGKREADHRCPACINRAAQARRRTLRVIKEESAMGTAVAAEPPRQMQREDRRIIISKLDEVYIDESVGYSGDWSDERVAEDLGVPRAWVSTIREENFGPEVSEDDAAIGALRTQHDALAARLKAQDEEHARLGAQIITSRADVKKLGETIAQFERQRAARRR